MLAEGFGEGEDQDMKNMLIGVAVGTLIGIGVVGLPAQAGPATLGSITVTGSGSMTLNRDQATTNLSVSYLAPTAKDAMAQATTGYNTVRAAIIGAGVKTTDLTTSGISLYPEYDYNVLGKTGSPVLKGYRASLSINVVSTVPLAATVLDTAVQIGGDALQIGGVSFDVANPAGVTDTSRARAVADAKLKAKDYARALGERLGRATKVIETQAAVPVPIYYAKATAAGAMDSSVNMDPGTQKVTSSVTITFELLG